MRRLPVLAMVAAVLAPGPILAQTYPAKVVRLVSPFPPGGGTDVVARVVAPKVAEQLGQPVIVENRVGAAGNIGAEYVARQPADGYTILVANSTLVTNPAVQKTPFSATKDFAPIAVVAATPIALAVHPSVPAKSVTELVALARQAPGKLSYSSCGNGTPQHFAGELFKQVAGVDVVHVAYKGCGPAIADGIGGQVTILFNTISNVTPQAKGGKLRVLAVASGARSPVDQSIPTIAEAGFAGFDADVWFGFLAPAGTAPAIVARVNEALNKVVSAPDIQKKMGDQFFSTRTSTPQAFAALIAADLAKWQKLAKDARIQAEP